MKYSLIISLQVLVQFDFIAQNQQSLKSGSSTNILLEETFNYPDGTIKIWGDKNAKDNKQAKKRYNHPYYSNGQKLTASGYNLVNLGGL